MNDNDKNMNDTNMNCENMNIIATVYDHQLMK